MNETPHKVMDLQEFLSQQEAEKMIKERNILDFFYDDFLLEIDELQQAITNAAKNKKHSFIFDTETKFMDETLSFLKSKGYDAFKCDSYNILIYLTKPSNNFEKMLRKMPVFIQLIFV